MILAGILALIYPVVSSFAAVFLLGCVLIVSGIVQGISLIDARDVPPCSSLGSKHDSFVLPLRSDGERLVLDENMFVEVVLPRGILRKLTDDEMEAYRAPYRDRERRLPTLIWPRELPIDGEPEDVVVIVDETARWLAANDRLPKLFINGDPGVIQTGRLRELVRAFADVAVTLDIWPNTIHAWQVVTRSAVGIPTG